MVSRASSHSQVADDIGDERGRRLRWHGQVIRANERFNWPVNRRQVSALMLSTGPDWSLVSLISTWPGLPATATQLPVEE
jgi:hypothetical protein